MNNDFMKKAIELAKQADKDIPVGAVIVKDNKIIAGTYNLKEQNNDITSHAEILALKQASEKLQNWRLDGCDIYVTLEPCPMCVGAIINARLDNVYFGAYDEKAGALNSKCQLMEMKFNHYANYQGGIMEKECAALLSDYFKAKRGKI